MREPRLRLLVALFVLAATVLSAAVAQRAANAPASGRVYKSVSADSANGKFRVTLDQLSAEEFGDVPFIATMSAVDRKRLKTLWQKDYIGMTLVLDPGLVVSDDGTGFVLQNEFMKWSLMNQNTSATIAVIDREELGYFGPYERKLIDFDDVNGEPAVRIWNCNSDTWKAVSAHSGQPIAFKAELAAKWNDDARGKIVERARRMGAAKLQQVELQLLAVRRNPDDRKWLQELLEPKKLGERSRDWGDHETGDGFWFRGGNHFQSTERDRRAADRMLAVFDGKATKDFSFEKKMESLYSSVKSFAPPPPCKYLGEVEGHIKFATPLRNPIGTLRIALVPNPQAGWENGPRVEWLESSAEIYARPDFSDEASFAFTTVKPGKYFAKAIWDHTAPFKNIAKAGAGDYDSDFVGPFIVEAGRTVTNILLVCTNRANASESYREDEAATTAWKRGDMIPADNGHVFAAGAGRWVIATNKFSVEQPAWINWIALSSTCLCPGQMMARPDPLVVYARRPATGGSNYLAHLRIIDAHGCSYKSRTDGQEQGVGVIEFQFHNFPRSDQTWRLIGSNAKNEDILDLTVTNLVRVGRNALQGLNLPVDVDINGLHVTVKSISAFPDGNDAEIKVNVNGGPPGDYRIGGIFIDADGNFIHPTEMCREQKAMRVVCNLWRPTRPPENHQFEFVINRENIQIQAQPAGPSSSGLDVLR